MKLSVASLGKHINLEIYFRSLDTSETKRWRLYRVRVEACATCFYKQMLLASFKCQLATNAQKIYALSSRLSLCLHHLLDTIYFLPQKSSILLIHVITIYLPWRFLSYSSHLKSYILHSMAFRICSASSSAELVCLCFSSKLIFSTSSSISSSTPPFLPSS